MSITLKAAAQLIMDKFYQDFAPRDAFFNVEDFARDLAIQYSAYLNDQYQMIRREGKAESGFSNVEIPPSWLIQERISVQYDEATKECFAITKQPLFSFPWDGFVNSLQEVKFVGVDSRKISLDEARFIDSVPTTPVCFYYLQLKDKIRFANKHPEGEGTALYVPVVSAKNINGEISEAIVGPLMDKVLQTYLVAKNGVVTQEVNDGNTNVALQNQVNPALTKAQQ